MVYISGLKVPISAVIPTCNRYDTLLGTFISISLQNVQPVEIIIIDASDDDRTFQLCKTGTDGLLSNIIWHKAIEKGAAVQRNQGTILATSDFILFLDDDILLEDHCLENLWKCIQKDPEIGGVGAFVTNQIYQSPGTITKLMYRLMSGVKLESYAGKCIGPAWNLWPEFNESINESQSVEWLSTVCVLYRRNILPQPVFPKIFSGYSYMEDVYLSLTIAKTHQLHINYTAKIYHDSQPGDHKKSVFIISRMQLINRHYIMRNVMDRRTIKDYGKLLLLEFFFIVSHVKNISKFPAYFGGKIAGAYDIITHKK